MRKTNTRATSPKNPGKGPAGFLLLAGLALLSGCQGISTGGSSNQQQTNTLSLASTSLSFGSVAVGSSKTVTVAATNSGNAPITISGAALSTKYFSLTAPSLPVLIAAGQSATLSVKFTPNAAGAFSGTAALTSDASDSQITVSLSGTGVADGQLVSDPTSTPFGNQTVGTKQSQTVTLTNSSSSSVNISKASISGEGYSLSGITTPLTLNASQSTTFTISFAPVVTGSATGAVTITSDASNPTLTIAASGTGVSVGALASNPTSLAFGSVTVGNKPTLSGTLTNTGGSSVTISQAGISGTGFTLSGITTPVTLTAGQSVNFTVTFAPPSAASFTGGVTITSTASNPTLTIPLSGTGTVTAGVLAVTPATLPLGSVVIGTSGTATGSLSASGASVTVTAASTNNSVFSISKLSLPMTIPAGQSVPFTVTFSPLTTGALSATATFASNAQSSTTTGTLTGTGLPVPVHSVNLSWTASTSSNIVGYNIYRAVYGTSCGNYTKINSVLNTGTLYTDSAVVDGTSYCYASTAVDSSNVESGYSNIVSNVQIPPP